MAAFAVASDTTIAELHEILQSAFDWSGEDVRNLQVYLLESASRASARLVSRDHAADGADADCQRPAGDGGKGEDQQPLRSEVLKTLDSIKWYLWHGNVFQALRHLKFVEMDLEGAAFETQEETTRKLLKAVEEFGTYIERNGGFIPNYGECYRNGERISTGFVESAVNQVVSKRMAKKQQMQWTQRGAHLLLQVRTRVLNEEWEDVFRRWYPDFRQQQSLSAAA